MTIRLETPRYIMRSVELDDDMGDWGSWISDPQTAQMLNARPALLSREQLRTYIQSFDRVDRHLLGIFERESGRLIGVRSHYIDWKRKDVLINLLIGDRSARNRGVQTETAGPTMRYWFETIGLESTHCSVLADNAHMLHNLEKMGYVLERRSTKASASGVGQVALLDLRLTREVWRQKLAG